MFVYKELSLLIEEIFNYSTFLFAFLLICPDFVLTGGVVIFEGMSVFACTRVFCDVLSLDPMILS